MSEEKAFAEWANQKKRDPDCQDSFALMAWKASAELRQKEIDALRTANKFAAVMEADAERRGEALREVMSKAIAALEDEQAYKAHTMLFDALYGTKNEASNRPR